MSEFWSALIVLVLLCGSAAAGFYVRRFIPKAHRSAESAALLQLVVGLLVTFAAIVLGLLTTSVKTAFDSADHNGGQYAAQLIELDRCLRTYGADADAIRRLLQDYTEGVIASTWPTEPMPAGLSRPSTAGTPGGGESEALGRILGDIDLDLRRLPATDTFHVRLATDCSAQLADIVKRRWMLIEEARGSISQPFLRVLVFWLMVIFASFGLYASHNGMVVAVVVLCAVCVSSALFVILDMDLPYGGLFGISSWAMRVALAHMLE